MQFEADAVDHCLWLPPASFQTHSTGHWSSVGRRVWNPRSAWRWSGTGSGSATRALHPLRPASWGVAGRRRYRIGRSTWGVWPARDPAGEENWWHWARWRVGGESTYSGRSVGKGVRIPLPSGNNRPTLREDEVWSEMPGREGQFKPSTRWVTRLEGGRRQLEKRHIRRDLSGGSKERNKRRAEEEA